MKVITVKQPWASLIVEGIKDIENRTWKCPEKYIGQRVLIHAAAMPWGNLGKDSCFGHILTREQYNKMLQLGLDEAREFWLDYYQFGSIIGSVEIVGCKINHPSIWAENSPISMAANTHLLRNGQKLIYNWILANPIKFPEPIPCKGKLSFWDYPNILAEPEEKGGKLFCHCQLPVKLENQVMPLGDGHYECRYCGGIWYR